MNYPPDNLIEWGEELERDLQSAHHVIADQEKVIAKLRAALVMIADYYEKYFREGDVAYQAALIARAALANEQDK